MIFKPGLYIVSTPIGNLDDITLRALNTLKHSTIILCEDTRISRKLLAKHNISARLQVYNDHSDAEQRSLIASFIDRGEIISLISDAGTPLISDPGYKLVAELKAKGYHIDIAPGVCSVVAALTLSGLPTDRFLFCGFLPKTAESRKKTFAELSSLKATLIFFESASRLQQSLVDARATLGNREICVTRELTKLYQEAKLGCLDEVIEFYGLNPPKGEIILMISGEPAKEDEQSSLAKLKQELAGYLDKNLTAKTATEIAYTRFGNLYSRNEIYKLANELKSHDKL